ncbi:isoamylase early set domain-containing protein [Motilibacter aurantiacus]|uniref:isoamylase early set domain-containing protein n=1 Tax=Motilibacter aurantiacus TaxID=2714955 RepID=UPI0014099934|nr:isoamylase early set domain-containing protein [Motilibacter aurantiacus]NHC45356.1 isoamylase [Motilibacter aurantiacus]
MIRRQRTGEHDSIKVTFVIDEQAHEGPVSVVGDFNDWKPGAHLLRRRSNGTRSVAVTLPTGRPVRFRYLGDGGRWFDDSDVDHLDGDGGLIKL